MSLISSQASHKLTKIYSIEGTIEEKSSFTLGLKDHYI